jgi:protein TonB
MKILKKNPDVDLKLKYKNVLNLGMVISLILMIFTFYSFQNFESGVTLPDNPDITIETIEIPQTQQLQKPPPPSRPSIPVESDDEDVEDDATIEETEVTLDEVNDLPPPPPPEDDEVYEFFAVSEKPVITHKQTPKYPELAKKAGIQGTVVINVTVSKTGRVEDARVFKSIPMLDDAALAAAKKCVFKPAKQRDKFVKVKLNIPFNFQLRN